MDFRSHRDYHHSHNSNVSHNSQRSAPNHGPSNSQQLKRNYKLLIDPFIVKGSAKVYRFDGVVEGDPTYPAVVVRDPRKHKIWIRPETLDLPVPRFKIDSNYVGPPPPLEVTIFNVNDNIDEQFLHNEVVNKHQCGVIEELQIYTHEFSRKHLGMARLVFEEPESARMCVMKMNNTTLMGKILHVFLDPFGNKCKAKVMEIVQQLEEEAKREEEAKEARKRPPRLPAKSLSLDDEDKEDHLKQRPPLKLDSERYDDERPGQHFSTASSSPSVKSNYYRDPLPSQVPLYQGPNEPPSVRPPPPSGQPPYKHYESFPHHHPSEPPPNLPPQQHVYPGFPYQNYRSGFPPGMPPDAQWGGSNPPGPVIPPGQPPISHSYPPPPGSAHPGWPPQQHNLPQEHPWEARYKEYQKNSHLEDCKDNIQPNDRLLGGPANEVDHFDDKSIDPKPESRTISEDEEDGKPGLDLETRIALILQSKDNNIAAPFLTLTEGSDEEEDGKSTANVTKKLEKSKIKSDSETKGSEDSTGSEVSKSVASSDEENGIDGEKANCSVAEDNDTLLSPPPSPFLSKDQYLFWHSKSLELKREAQKREEKENNERLKKLKKKRGKKKFKEKELTNDSFKLEIKDEVQVNGGDDDRMSLSSLSSTEDPILHRDIPIPPPPANPPSEYPPPPPQYSGHNNYSSYVPPGYPPPHLQQENSYSWQVPSQVYPHTIPPMTNYSNYNNTYLNYPPPGGHGYPPVGNLQVGHHAHGQIPLYPSWQNYHPSGPDNRGHQSGEYHDPTVNSVLDTVIDELKCILKKDFNKRMIEATAYKTFEAWWDEQQTKFKTQNETKQKSLSDAPLSKPDKINSLTNLFENKDAFGLDGINAIGSFGIGFRAAMPKMPSFRKVRKIKPPSPPCLDEDSRGAQSDEDSKQSSSLQRLPGQSSCESDTESLPPPTAKSTSNRNNISEDEDSFSSDEGQNEADLVDATSSESSAEDSSTSSSSDIESDREEKADSEELKELQRLEEEFNNKINEIVKDYMRTPERESRTPTPVPFDTPMDEDVWEEVKSPLHILPPKKVSPVKTTTKHSPEKMNAASHRPLKQKKPTAKTKDAKITKKTKTTKKDISKPEISSETDTADERSDIDIENSMELPEFGQHNGQIKSESDSSQLATEEKRHSPVLMEHSYCLPWANKTNENNNEVEESQKKVIVSGLDHDYTRPRTPPKEISPKKNNVFISHKKLKGKENQPRKKLIESNINNINKNVTNKSDSIFKRRNQMEEYNTLYSFLLKGIDQEDIDLLKRSYEKMLADDRQSFWLNDTHWVDHPSTDVPPPLKKRKKVDDLPLHKSGSARTEGIYKVDSKQKQKHKFTFHEEINQMPEEQQPQSLAVLESSKAKPTQMSVSREVRSFQRRLLAAFGNETDSDLLKFNQLKFRKKLLKFGKSRIHDWGLFALEGIAADEMVIEYVGQSIRPIIADLREVHYEKMGIGSSYLFRIDMENIIDATKCGNLARFINHSCNPNCYARIISVENQKKIVIYSKQPIACGEEITYDYKFPIEDEKIVCLCGGASCKGTLN